MDDDTALSDSVDFLIKNTDMFTIKDTVRLTEQVKGHKYFLDRQYGRDVSWKEAMLSCRLGGGWEN